MSVRSQATKPLLATPDAVPTGVLGQLVGARDRPAMATPDDPDAPVFDPNVAALAVATLGVLLSAARKAFRSYQNAPTVAAKEASNEDIQGTLQALENELVALRTSVAGQADYIRLLEAQVRRDDLTRARADENADEAAARRREMLARGAQRRDAAAALVEQSRARIRARDAAAGPAAGA